MKIENSDNLRPTYTGVIIVENQTIIIFSPRVYGLNNDHLVILPDNRFLDLLNSRRFQHSLIPV